ncbi:probable phosphatase 2C 34 [Olea europaea subsp. europaea]|uniref:Probable phosphatase 2C 34 n=1 Tax=Olea europaea subsp. europaea TaxID=158383 RepID=A0A8S0PPS7_OLEEU|nr:probable phosphatase 2C 34 [Olea europaea subsp. europaea]
MQVWDVISNEEAVQIVSSTPDRVKSGRRLVDCAVHAWKKKRKGIAMDDISKIAFVIPPPNAALRDTGDSCIFVIAQGLWSETTRNDDDDIATLWL